MCSSDLRLHINAVIRRAGHIGCGHADIAACRCVTDIDAVAGARDIACNDAGLAAAIVLGVETNAALAGHGTAAGDYDVAAAACACHDGKADGLAGDRAAIVDRHSALALRIDAKGRGSATGKDCIIKGVSF